ncbi:hypothetical protein P154DRAFT_517877 [Amniculicola lignicola CBS 123094]|uniref:Uncharacterized protein n=1 Tax=Amniculicola lignicola CBS 123094 TaxID=1392246 RepID=A0A6A5WX99_9PLEO|nr:hypothetical protein P154DRAFT_517877 [Amniculicola lignicola CBS 123094]
MTFLSKLRKNAETILFGPAPPKRNYQYSYTPGSSVYETSTQDTPAQASSLNTVGSNNTPGAHAQSRNAPAPDSSIHPGAPKRDTQSLPHLKICSTPESPFLQFPDKDWAVMSRLDLLDKDQQKLLSQEDGAMLEEIFDLLAKEDIREILAKKREEEREEEERRRNPLRSQSVEGRYSPLIDWRLWVGYGVDGWLMGDRLLQGCG